MARLALIFSVAALASLFGAASALACITQNPSAGLQGAEQGTPVHPGSRMAYSVAGLDIGAKYRVYVGDRPVTDELTKDSSEAKGTFTLGDYGSLPRSLPVWVNIDHPDAGTGHADPFTGNRPGLDVNYVPRSAPGTQDKPTPAPAVGDRPTAPAATT